MDAVGFQTLPPEIVEIVLCDSNVRIRDLLHLRICCRWLLCAVDQNAPWRRYIPDGFTDSAQKFADWPVYKCAMFYVRMRERMCRCIHAPSYSAFADPKRTVNHVIVHKRHYVSMVRVQYPITCILYRTTLCGKGYDELVLPLADVALSDDDSTHQIFDGTVGRWIRTSADELMAEGFYSLSRPMWDRTILTCDCWETERGKWAKLRKFGFIKTQ